MWVRVTRFSLEGQDEVSDEELQLELKRADEAVRRNVADNYPGWQGYQYMIDRAARRALALTYWRTREDMVASEPEERVIRQAGLPPLEIESIDRFEIIAAYGPGYR